MTDVMKFDKNSRENIAAFLETIQSKPLQKLVEENLDDILAIGAFGTSSAAENRSRFYEAMNIMVEQMMGDTNED